MTTYLAFFATALLLTGAIYALLRAARELREELRRMSRESAGAVSAELQ